MCANLPNKRLRFISFPHGTCFGVGLLRQKTGFPTPPPPPPPPQDSVCPHWSPICPNGWWVNCGTRMGQAVLVCISNFPASLQECPQTKGIYPFLGTLYAFLGVWYSGKPRAWKGVSQRLCLHQHFLPPQSERKQEEGSWGKQKCCCCVGCCCCSTVLAPAVADCS